MLTSSMICSFARSSRSQRALAVGVAAALAAIPAGSAFASIWTDWTSRSYLGNTGGMGAGTLRVDGEDVGVSYEGTGIPFRFGTDFQMGNPFTSGREHLISSSVQEAPGDSGDLDFVYFQIAGSHRRDNYISFSRPVTNPIIAVVSFGRVPGTLPQEQYYSAWQFDADFTILSSNTEVGVPGQGLTRPIPGCLVGSDGTGVIMFEGTYSGIGWRFDTNHFDFPMFMQVGALGSAIPSPGALALLGGAGLLGQYRRRR